MIATETTHLNIHGNLGYGANIDDKYLTPSDRENPGVLSDILEPVESRQTTQLADIEHQPLLKNPTSASQENRLAKIKADCAKNLYALIDTKDKSYGASIAISGITLSPLFFLSDTHFGKIIAGVDFFFNSAYMRNEASNDEVDLTSMHKTMVDTTTFNMLAATVPLLLNLLPKNNNPSTYAIELAVAAAIVAVNQKIFSLVSDKETSDQALSEKDSSNETQAVEDIPNLDSFDKLIADQRNEEQQNTNKRDTAKVSLLSTAGKVGLLAYKMKHEAHSPSDDCIQMTTALQGLWILGRIVANLETNVRPISSSGPSMLNGLVTMVVAQTFALALSAVSHSPDGQATNSPGELLKVALASKAGGDIVYNSLKGMIYAFKQSAPEKNVAQAELQV